MEDFFNSTPFYINYDSQSFVLLVAISLDQKQNFLHVLHVYQNMSFHYLARRIGQNRKHVETLPYHTDFYMCFFIQCIALYY